MKHAYFVITLLLACTQIACKTDSHHYTQNAQKIVSAINAKYPADKTTLVFIDAPDGFIARQYNNTAVKNSVDTGKVAAIVSSLAFKTNTVIVAGENEQLTATTMTKALTTGKDKINGSKAILIGAKESHKTYQKTLADLAVANGVTLEFIDNPI